MVCDMSHISPNPTPCISNKIVYNTNIHKDILYRSKWNGLDGYLWPLVCTEHLTVSAKKKYESGSIDRSPIECVPLMTTTVTEMLDPVFSSKVLP